jgi:MFS family permease
LVGYDDKSNGGLNTVTDKAGKDKRMKIATLIFMGIPVYGAIAFGLLGAFMGLIGHDWSPLHGFLYGAEIGVAVGVVSLAGVFGWEWIKKQADKGKLLPYLLVGFAAAIAISGLLAINMGKPSCEESGDAPYSSCVSYADDGFEATSAQHWHKFWETLPIATLISLPIAYIVHDQVEKKGRG